MYVYIGKYRKNLRLYKYNDDMYHSLLGQEKKMSSKSTKL